MCVDGVQTQQTSEDLKDEAVGRCVHEAHRMTDSATMKSSCSRSPRPIVRYLLLWIPSSLDTEVPPALFVSDVFCSVSFSSGEVSTAISRFWKLEPAMYREDVI